MTSDRTSKQKTRDLRSFRSRQTALHKRFIRELLDLGEPGRWQEISDAFVTQLMEEKSIEPTWINPERYPMALYNIFTALGFQVFADALPRASGVQSTYSHPLLAFHPSRAVLLNDHASSLFSDIADMQPLCPVPILGLAYNRVVAVPKARLGSASFVAQMQQEGRRVAGALAMGHVALSFDDVASALALNPSTQADKLGKIAARTGILSFLKPPIDALPIFGQHASANRGVPYGIDTFLSEARVAAATGAELAPGDVTQASPGEAFDEPERYVRDLGKAKLLDTAKQGSLNATQKGYDYLRSRVLPFPIAQLLQYITYQAAAAAAAARQEDKSLRSGNYLAALQGQAPPPRADAGYVSISIDNIDSFAAVGNISPDSIRNSIPVTLPEAHIKSTICAILGESVPKDWGGEQNDLFTTRVKIDGRRVPTAFLFKGPAVKGRLTIAKCGKNGDQIQRLFESPAELFVIQFNGRIDQRVVREATDKVLLLRSHGFPSARYAIVDGRDTARLLAAYAPLGK